MIENGWLEPLSPEFGKPYYKKLYQKVRYEYEHHRVFPDSRDLFAAFLCFSVKPGVAVPPSLVNIYQELHKDLGCRIPDNGCLVPWAKQGVLLLNTVLTVRAHQAFSHRGIGWEQFTDAAIRALNAQDRPIVFMLWGRPAQEKAAMLDNPRHLILKAAHPSPLSAQRGFFGCRHFSRCNEFLVQNGENPIDWQIPDLYRQ